MNLGKKHEKKETKKHEKKEPKSFERKEGKNEKRKVIVKRTVKKRV